MAGRYPGTKGKRGILWSGVRYHSPGNLFRQTGKLSCPRTRWWAHHKARTKQPGISFGNANDFKSLDLGITRSSGFMTALMTRFTPPGSASYQFRIQIGQEDFASLWIDQNQSGSFPDYTICSSDITISQPIALEEGESYNLLLAHGVPSGSIASNLSTRSKSDNDLLPNWTLIDPADPAQIKYYHLTFDGNLSDRISSVTLFQDGPTERLNLLGLRPQTTHRASGGESIETEGNSSLQPATWMHLFTQVDDENDFLEIYLNGDRVAQKDLPENPFPTNPSAAPWRFGLGTLPLALDEIRVSSNSRSSDWIKAAYDNQSASSVFPHHGSIEGEESFLLPDLVFTTPAESYFELFVDATGEPLAFLASGLPGGMTINPADGNLSGTPFRQVHIRSIWKPIIWTNPSLNSKSLCRLPPDYQWSAWMRSLVTVHLPLPYTIMSPQRVGTNLA